MRNENIKKARKNKLCKCSNQSPKLPQLTALFAWTQKIIPHSKPSFNPLLTSPHQNLQVRHQKDLFRTWKGVRKLVKTVTNF